MAVWTGAVLVICGLGALVGGRVSIIAGGGISVAVGVNVAVLDRVGVTVSGVAVAVGGAGVRVLLGRGVRVDVAGDDVRLGVGERWLVRVGVGVFVAPPGGGI